MTKNEEMFELKKYKKTIKARDGFRCQNPECNLRFKSKKYIRLTIHHIDYDKDNIVPWNLITLCNGCKVESRYNRLYSFSVYSEIMMMKYPNDWPHLNIDDAIERFKEKIKNS